MTAIPTYSIAMLSRRLATAVLALAGGAAVARAEWPGFRGPNSDGAAAAGLSFRGAEGTSLAVAWRATLGPGYAGVAVVDGRVVTAFSDGSNDLLVAFDAERGTEVWRARLGETYRGHDGSFDGPIATPVVADGRVFGFGPRGHLIAVELSGGRLLWQKDVVAEQGGKKPYYGFGASPLVAGGVLVVEIGAEGGKAIAGFDPATGALRWSVGEDQVNYQSPVLLRVEGREQVVAVGQKKLFGIDPAGGALLWEYEHGGDASPIGAESLVPVPAGEGRLFLKNRSDTTSMIQIATRPEGGYGVTVLWTKPVLRTTYSIPVYHDGYLYGLNGRVALTCVDAASGEMLWRSREPGDGFPLLVGDELVILTKERTLHVGPASPRGWQERARIELFEDVVWTPPSFAGGAVFARSQGEIARVEWRAAAPAPVVAGASSLIAGTSFERLLGELGGAEQSSLVIDRFLAAAPSLPLIEWPDRVIFIYRGPGADLGLAGDLIGERRELPMQRVEGTDLFWRALRVESDVRVSYQFVRDYEERIPDPLNPRRAASLRLGPGGPSKIEVSSLEMPAWKPPSFLGEPERRGRLELVSVASTKRAGAKLDLQVYLPTGHAPDRAPLPVAYVLGGDQARELGEVPRALDNLIGRTVAPLIVVFCGEVDWGEQRPGFEEEAKVQAELIATEVVAAVESRYPVRAEPAARAIIGNGFDGWTAAYAAFHFRDVFGAFGSQSLFMLESGEAELQPEIATADLQPLRIFLEWARYELRATVEAWDMGRTNRRFWELLRDRGYRPAGGEAPEGFGWPSWRHRTDRLFEALFPSG
jgi:enterochelin esterase-like enzyme/outer membrane protein assembly factor BamB